MAYRSDIYDLYVTTDGAVVFIPFVDDTTNFAPSGSGWTVANDPTFNKTGIGVSPNTNWANFDGSNDTGGFPDNAAFDSASFSVEAWVNMDTHSGSNQYIATRYNNFEAFSANSWEFYIGSDQKLRGRVFVGNDGSRVVVSTDVIPTGEWVHVAYTRESGAGKLYVNGQPDTTETGSGSANSSAQPINVGARRLNAFGSYSLFFDGGIAYLAFYTSVLSASDIEAHYDQMFAGSVSAEATLGGLTATASPSVFVFPSASIGLGGLTNAGAAGVGINLVADAALGAVTAAAAATLEPRSDVNLGLLTATAAPSVAISSAADVALGGLDTTTFLTVFITPTATVALAGLDATAGRFLPQFASDGFVTTRTITHKVITGGDDPVVIEVQSTEYSAFYTQPDILARQVADDAQVIPTNSGLVIEG